MTQEFLYVFSKNSPIGMVDNLGLGVVKKADNNCLCDYQVGLMVPCASEGASCHRLVGGKKVRVGYTCKTRYKTGQSLGGMPAKEAACYCCSPVVPLCVKMGLVRPYKLVDIQLCVSPLQDRWLYIIKKFVKSWWSPPKGRKFQTLDAQDWNDPSV